MKPMKARRAEMYAQVADRAKETALSLGICADLAEHIGAAVADGLAEDFGGQMMSFPLGSAYRLSRRELSILADHAGGMSWQHLIRKYHMTERGIRLLIRRANLRRSGSVEQMPLL
ncbi:MAG: DNA-binding protein [Proteobacteria bacterium]|nr:DNA-binding protein [Pseudomonadota bacterium]